MTRILTLALLLLVAAPAAGQTTAPACRAGGPRCITVSFNQAEMREVAAVFAEFSGHSVILGADVAGQVTAEVRNQPWDVAFRAILGAHGLDVRQVAPGLLRVDPLERVAEQAVQAPLATRVFRLDYVPAADIARVLEGVRSERGRIAVSEATNAIVVTDTEAVLATVERLIGHP
jgi:type IV pilus assembly protein PilQ